MTVMTKLTKLKQCTLIDYIHEDNEKQFVLSFSFKNCVFFFCIT